MSSNEDLQAHIDSLWINCKQQAHRIRQLEKQLDTRNTALWRRIVFRLDGWPSWTVVADKPQWRPWRKWWTS